MHTKGGAFHFLSSYLSLFILPIEGESRSSWLNLYYQDFYKRFLNLLPMSFGDMPAALALEIMGPPPGISAPSSEKMTLDVLLGSLSPFDLKRLEGYSADMVDYHLILDLLPTLCHHYFMGKIQMAHSSELLTPVQMAILLSIGCQKKSMDDLEKLLNLPASQLLAMFIKIVKKFSSYYKGIQENTIAQELSNSSAAAVGRPIKDEALWDPTVQSLDDDLEESGGAVSQAFREKQRELVDSINMEEYAISVPDDEWSGAVQESRPSAGTTSLSVKKKDSARSRAPSLFKTLQAKQEQEKMKRISKEVAKTR